MTARINKYLLYLLFVCSLWSTVAEAQWDSARVEVGSQGVFGTSGYLPYQLASNRYGRFEEQRSTDGFVNVAAMANWRLHKHWMLRYGAEGLLKGPIKESYLHQAYVQLNYRFLSIDAGRYQTDQDSSWTQQRSSGDLGMSRNAQLIPGISLSVPRYHPVPFVGKWLRFKGAFSHRWMDHDRMVRGAYLHEKSGYLQLGTRKRWSLEAGFVHFALWGGYHRVQDVQIPEEFPDFMRVVFGRSARTITGSTRYRGEALNGLGSHFGLIDLRFNLRVGDAGKLTVYNVTPFEDASGLKYFLNRDRMLGVSWDRTDKKGISGITAEFVQTTWQSGPGVPDSVDGQSNFGYTYGGRDDYYNNYWYQNGWTYNGRIVGTPLFIERNRIAQYGETIEDYGVSIVSNRVRAFHLGLSGWTSKSVAWKILLTHSINYGTYAGLNGGRYKWGSRDPNFDNSSYPFLTPQHQSYGMLALDGTLPFCANCRWNAAVSSEWGDFGSNFGMILGIRWQKAFKKT